VSLGLSKNDISCHALLLKLTQLSLPKAEPAVFYRYVGIEFFVRLFGKTYRRLCVEACLKLEGEAALRFNRTNLTFDRRRPASNICRIF